MGFFFTDYKPDIMKCAQAYSADYQKKYQNDSLEEKAAAIKLFSHISDFLKEVPDNEIRKAVKKSRYGIKEVTLNMLHNLFLFYINEAANMTGETFLSTAVKAYRFVNDNKYEGHMIDLQQYQANDELIDSIVPASTFKVARDNHDDHDDLQSESKGIKEQPAFKPANEVGFDLVAEDANSGLLSYERMPLPLLAEQGGSVTHQIFNYVKDFFLNEVKEGRKDESELAYSIYHITMLWSVLAGIGTMALWDKEGESILDKGIISSLTEERGFFEMDEFVLDMVTDGFNSEESEELKQRLEMHIQPMIHELFTTFSEDGVDTELRMRQFINNCIGLYMYGLVVQEDRSEAEEPSTESVQDDYKTNDITELGNEERCGIAWLKIAGQEDMDEGLGIMQELGNEDFDDGYLALAMFTSDQNKRKELLKKAADVGNAEAMWQYSAFVPHSHAADTGSSGDEEWLKYVVAAAEGGCVDAMNELGNIFNRQNNHAESMYWYAMANYYGHHQGMMGMEGIARKWKAAGMPRAHIKGSPSFDENRFKCAISFLELHSNVAPTYNAKDMFGLALNGTALAAYLAGDIYESQGVYEMAYKVFNAISFEHDPHGMKCYADMLMTGRGTEQRPDDAFRVYEMAANAGDRESMFTMGEYYRNKGNENLAAYWYGKAYARGYEPAESRLIQMAN